MPYYGQDFMLEDRCGQLTGSDFEDINDRVRLTLRCTQRESTHTIYMIFDRTNSVVFNYNNPLAVLDFGPNDTLGTISFKPGMSMPMKNYLSKLSGPFAKSTVRKFVAQDGQEYLWTYKTKPDQEWACTNARGYPVAAYNLKLYGEPEYQKSSGCMLTVDETYPHLLAEMLASLTIMRHILAHNL